VAAAMVNELEKVKRAAKTSKEKTSKEKQG